MIVEYVWMSNNKAKPYNTLLFICLLLMSIMLMCRVLYKYECLENIWNVMSILGNKLGNYRFLISIVVEKTMVKDIVI